VHGAVGHTSWRTIGLAAPVLQDRPPV